MPRFAIVVFTASLFALFALGACKRSPPPPTGPAVRLFVDETSAGEMRVSAEPVALATKLPKGAADPATWRRLEARSSDGRFLDIRTPTTTYENAEVRLYLAQGQAAIGLFRPVREGLPENIASIARQPAVSLTGLIEVRVHTRDPVPVPVASVAIEVPGLPAFELVGDDLEELAPVEGSGNRGREIADILAVRVRGTITSVVIEARDGTTHAITAADMADPAKDTLLKLNNKDQWVYREFPQGKEAGTEVRDVVKLTLTGTGLRERGGD